MKLKSIALTSMLVAGMISTANAADQGSGKVTFKGSIIDAPCSISPDSVDQTVDLGQVANVALANGGTSTPRVFDINLENCVFENDKSVQLTFTGATASFDNTSKTLGIVGTAAGAGIQITNGSGDVVVLGEANPLQAIQNGNNTLRFSAYLKGNGGAIDTITPGDFNSVADFTLNYQ